MSSWAGSRTIATAASSGPSGDGPSRSTYTRWLIRKLRNQPLLQLVHLIKQPREEVEHMR